jgi:DNA-binding NarL/FixJ family response regulator
MSERTSQSYSSAAPAEIKVAVVEDLQDIRESLKILINGAHGFRCTNIYFSVEDALTKLDQASPDALPDVILMDIGLPGMSGIEGIKILKERRPELIVMVLTVYDDDDRIFNALCAGACGYLLKKTPPARLLEDIKEAVNGGAPMTPEIARRVIELFQKFRPPAQVDYHLKPHEYRLLKLLAEGHSYRSAAEALNVSQYAVSFHLRNIYEKLQVHSKSEAVAKALREGLIH